MERLSGVKWENKEARDLALHFAKTDRAVFRTYCQIINSYINPELKS